jgi:hypothetical protein
MTSRRASALALGACLALLASGCGSAPHPAAPQPPPVPGQVSGGPDLSGVKFPNFIMPILRGRVSRPDRTLTPGVVATTDTNVVCALPKREVHQTITFATQNAIYAAYGYTTPAEQHKYTLDFLVPPGLGGALVRANIWPAAVRGTGFFQKEQLNSVLRDMVCRRQISLTLVQAQLRKDWYAAWLQYVVATGRA